VGYFVGNHLKLEIPNSKFEIRNSKFEENGDLRFGYSDFLISIQKDLWQETAHALVLRDQQLSLNAELNRSGIRALWLKGLVLAEQLYGRFEARHCCDLDLLVDAADVQRVEELLARLGFERYRPTEAGKEFHPMAAHHSIWCAKVLPDWRLNVELHHRLSGPPRCQPAVSDLLNRSRLVGFHGREIRVPSHEDELLILCLHAHHHNYALLRCLMDVAEFVRRFHDQIDWQSLVHVARESRCLGRLRVGLEIADALLGLENREHVFAGITQLTPRQRWAVNALPVAALLDPRTQLDDFHQARLTLLMDSWADAVRSLSPRIFPSRDHVRDLCPPICRWAPGLPRMYYYIHSAGRMIRHSSPDYSIRTR
jgi:hypothetical protein